MQNPTFKESRISENSSRASVSRGSNHRRSNNNSKRKSKGGKSGPKVPKSHYRFNCYVTEDAAKPVFSVQFNHYIKDRNIFAAASVNRISIYECVSPPERDDEDDDDEMEVDEKDYCGIKLLRAYDDPDKDEMFYTVAWSHDNGNPVLAFGGVRSVVRAIWCNAHVMKDKKFIGHTNAINEMKFHPKLPHILLTASKDHSMRLWNIKTEICVAILGGVNGHRDEVLAIDFDPFGEHIVSGGMDHNIKVWKIDTEEIQDAIANSSTFYDTKKLRTFPTRHIHFADYTTRSVHRNYVDSVKWFGETFLSKSCENNIIWFKPGNLEDKQLNLNTNSVSVIHTFDVDDSELWFVRMDVDASERFIAVGNSIGKIFLFDLDSDTPNIKPSIMSNQKSTKPIRQVSFSRDGSILVASCDDGKIFRWDKKE